MVHRYFMFALIVFVCVVNCGCNSNVCNSNGWELVWADEFDQDGRPAAENWIYEQGFVRNEELQWYQPENAFCKDGMLIIEARREKVSNSRYDAESDNWRRSRKEAEYTSACVLTRGLREWQYGRFEIRAKIDTRMGMWPAIWTLGVSKGWPRNGEIDIMEYYQYEERGHILANAAWGGERRYEPVWDTVRKPLDDFLEDDPDWESKFHIWRMDWDEKFIRLYLDDELLNETDLSGTINPDGTNPFHQPHYLLLNLAIGAHGGNPSETKFPARYEIDYVRVYKKK